MNGRSATGEDTTYEEGEPNLQCQYLFKLRVSQHALQGVEDRIPLHGRQGLPRDFAGVVIQTLHFRG